jgi:hypothetical protein
MSWRVDSSTGAHLWDTRPLSPEQVLERDDNIRWLMQHERPRWGVINGHLYESGAPTASIGAYGGLSAYPPAQALTAVTGGTANVAWWSPALYTPLPANGLLAPSALRITAHGLVTSSGASQTITMNPAIGTAVAGTALGASSALALGSTITGAYWHLDGDLTVRTVGSAGTAIAGFEMHWGTAAGATATVSNALFGHTSATGIDFTAAQGILIAATPNNAGVSVTPDQIHMLSWN